MCVKTILINISYRLNLIERKIYRVIDRQIDRKIDGKIEYILKEKEKYKFSIC